MPDEPSHPGEMDASSEATPAEKRPRPASIEKVPGVTGVVLAGGRSRRFGRNKALARVHGVPMIERVVRVLQQVFDGVILSANDPAPYRFLGLPTVEDLHPGVGPLGGLHAGLTHMPDDAGFFTACDMPFLDPGLIRYMARLSQEADAVIPRIGEYVEPLHALYRKRCLDPLLRAIHRGERRIVSFYPAIRIRYVTESEIRAFDPNLDAFTDVNRPEELRLPMEPPGGDGD
jgi:molybdopterin-guanine dinucleotide biosynthesis protein A